MWLGNGIILSKPAMVRLYFDIGYKQIRVLISFHSIYTRNAKREKIHGIGSNLCLRSKLNTYISLA